MELVSLGLTKTSAQKACMEGILWCEASKDGVDATDGIAIGGFNIIDLAKLSEQLGKVPEVLRLAHLIGSAIKSGQSSNQA